MTAPWPPPATAPTTSAPQQWGPAVAWLLLLVATAAALLASVLNVPWVSGRLPGGGVIQLNAGDIVNRVDGVVPFAVLATVAGLVVATWFGLAAVPGTVVGRVVLTVVVLLLAALVTVTGLRDRSVTPEEGLLVVGLVCWLPTLVLLLLTWRAARRGAAWTAVVFTAVAVLGAGVVLLQVLRGLGAVGPGTWLALLLATAGLVGAVLLLRWVPRRPRPLQPGDPGWTA